MIEIILPFKTPTINNLYGKTFRHKSLYLKPEGKKLKKEIIEIVKNTPIDPIFYPPRKLKVDIEIHENWLTKKNTVKKKDVANREKFIIDSVFDGLGADDSYIFEHTMKKIQSHEEFCIIKIEEYVNDDIQINT